MPIGPVHTLVRWLEAAGCLVFEEDFGTSRVDGMSQWVGDHPVILLNGAAPTDRKRLTLAHELGHLVLHSQEVTPELEREAVDFAAEFLMPMQVIRPQLRTLKPGRLHDLKREWGVSMQALIERAYEARLLTPADRKRLYSALGVRDWRLHEPVSDELPPRPRSSRRTSASPCAPGASAPTRSPASPGSPRTRTTNCSGPATASCGSSDGPASGGLAGECRLLSDLSCGR